MQLRPRGGACAGEDQNCQKGDHSTCKQAAHGCSQQELRRSCLVLRRKLQDEAIRSVATYPSRQQDEESRGDELQVRGHWIFLG